MCPAFTAASYFARMSLRFAAHVSRLFPKRVAARFELDFETEELLMCNSGWLGTLLDTPLRCCIRQMS